MPTRSYQFGASQLTITFGDITSSDAQAIVSSDDYYLTMGGGVSGAILNAGGQEVMLDAAKKVPAKVGDVVVTTAGRLKAHYIFHAVTIQQFSGVPSAGDIIRKCVSKCFDLADVLELRSIAFPAIGAGAARFSYQDVAVQMADVISGRLATSTHPLQITLFLFDRRGQMQPMDFVNFFEEFAARRPQVAAKEVVTPRPVPASDDASHSPQPNQEIARQQQSRLRLNELTMERTKIEEDLARLQGRDGAEKDQLLARAASITAERIETLALYQQAQSEPLSLFISYSHKDQTLREELEKQLSILRRQGVISAWTDRQISAGTEWAGAIDDNMNSARVILLLISPDFMASDYCYDIELKRAMLRHELREAVVIPVILRQVMWDRAPFAKLNALPTDGKAVTTWANQDVALENVARGIRAAIESIQAGRA